MTTPIPNSFNGLRTALLQKTEDLKTLPQNIEGETEHQRFARSHIAGHIANTVKISLFNEEISFGDRVPECIMQLNAMLRETRALEADYGQIRKVPEVLTECLQLCVAFLEKQQVPEKGAGFGGRAS